MRLFLREARWKRGEARKKAMPTDGARRATDDKRSQNKSENAARSETADDPPGRREQGARAGREGPYRIRAQRDREGPGREEADHDRTTKANAHKKNRVPERGLCFIISFWQ